MEDVPGQRFGGGIGFGAADHVHLAEQHQAFSFVVFEQRAVLEAKAAIEDWKEIPSGGLLDQDRGDVAAVAATPEARDREVAPFYGYAVEGTDFIFQARRKERGLAAPVVKMLCGKLFDNRMLAHA